MARLLCETKGKIMRIKDDEPEQSALTISQSATVLGLNEFSLLSRIQAGEITATRLRSGEMAILENELERLAKLSKHSLTIPSNAYETPLSDNVLGIKRESGGLMRDGERQSYSVPDGGPRRFTDSEMKGYRAAFGAIAGEFHSLGELKKQLENPAKIRPSSDKEIVTSQLGVWQVRSTLLNLGQSEILLCQQENNFAAIERFRDNALYAKANGGAEILLERNDPKELKAAFNENAKHTLEFMASNQVATAQKIVWEQFPEHRPERVIEAISERCRLAVADKETISQSVGCSNSNNQARSRGMSI
jgi:hypothetical protein